MCVCVLHARQMRDGFGNLSARSRGSARERERDLVGLEGERRQTLSNLQIQFMLAALIYACLESSYRRYRRQHNYLSITNHTHACSAAQTVAPSFVSTETIKCAAGHCQVNQPIKRTLAGARSVTGGRGSAGRGMLYNLLEWAKLKCHCYLRWGQKFWQLVRCPACVI